MLNKSQQEAVDTINGQLLMIACPGSGKTTTMVHRIINMVKDGVSPNNIIMMTFTKAAADEMKERYLKMDGAEDGVTFCTIHSLCYNILKSAGNMKRVIIESETSEYFEELIRKKYSRQIADISSFVSELIHDISRKKMSPDKAFYPQCTKDEKFFNRLYQDYEEYKEEYDLMDYNDMIICAYDVLKHNRELLKAYQNKYRYIQVDEYQDTDEMQKRVIYLIAGKDGNLAVVGDEDQCIYSFKGATPTIMLNFKKDYPKAKIINMGTNYRSSPNIIDKADSLIKENKQRFNKEFSAAKRDIGTIKQLSFKTRKEEINGIVDRISKMIKDGTDPNEIAILYRNNSQAEDFCYSFISKKIPFRVAGSVSSRFNHFIWQDIVAYRKVSIGEGTKYDVAKVLSKPNRYLPLPAFEEFPDISVDGCMELTPENEMFLRSKIYEDMFKFSKAEQWKLDSKAKAVSNFFSLLRNLANIKDPVSFMRKLYPTYKKYIIKTAEFRNLDESELIDKYEEYIEIARQHGNDWGKLNAYIYSYNEMLRENRKSKTGVVLSTMHKSKGLEWDNVFIVDCVDGVCPSNRGTTDIEDERRLFYVAVTRARTNLFLASYKYDGNFKERKESVFLKPFKDI